MGPEGEALARPQGPEAIASLGLLGLGLSPLPEGWTALLLHTTQGDRHALWHGVPGSRWAVHGLEAGPDEAPFGPEGPWQALALALAQQGYALALWRLPAPPAAAAHGLRLRMALQVGEALGTQAAAWRRGEGLEAMATPLPPLALGMAPIGLGFGP